MIRIILTAVGNRSSEAVWDGKASLQLQTKSSVTDIARAVVGPDLINERNCEPSLFSNGFKLHTVVVGSYIPLLSGANWKGIG